MLTITNHLHALLNSITIENRPKRIDSPKFTEEYKPRSPLKTNLYKYDVEQDYIEDSSPINNKFSEYKPVDQRTTKYFTLEDEEEHYDRNRQKDKSIPHQNYRLSRNQGEGRFGNAEGREEPNSRTRAGVLSENR